MMSEQNAIAVTDQRIGDWLGRTAKELSGYAARSYNFDAWQKTAFLAIVESPNLRKAIATDAGRVSIHHALRRAASIGLSLNPQEGKACLVPYQDKIQYQIMKDGYIDLMLDGGQVTFVRVGTVYANDEWEETQTSKGDEYRLTRARRERGEIDLFYAAAHLKDGQTILMRIDRDQALEHRKKYSPHTQLGEKEYGEKTVAKMLCKTAKIAGVAPIVSIAAAKDEADIEPELRDVTPERGTPFAEVVVPAVDKTVEVAADDRDTMELF